MRCPKCNTKMVQHKLRDDFSKENIPYNFLHEQHLDYECNKCRNRKNPSINNYGYSYIYFPHQNLLYVYFLAGWHEIDTKDFREKVILT